MHLRRLFCCVAMILVSATAFAQQTGTITGRVSASDGSALPGVTVEARSNVLPQPRVSVTDASGEYRLPALVPGAYTLTFSLSGMQTATRRAQVLLADVTTADAQLGVAGVTETITVTAEATLVDKQSTALQSTVTSDEMHALPIGQEYRDLVKLAPAIMYTQDAVRGPSAGGSGQDNVFQFDGVNVSLPQYGTLAAEPASYDIQEISIVKGGAKAVDFNRAGGFTMDSVSKTGTNKFSGQVSYQVQNKGMRSALKRGTNSLFDQDKTWAEMNIGGPLLRDRVFFFGSYYRPTITRVNRANLYGDLPEYDSERNEGFGKLTATPMSSLLINASYRSSKRLDKSSLFGSAAAATTGTGNESRQKIAIVEGSWIINPRSYATAKFNDYKLYTLGRPDFASEATVSTALGTRIDITNLDRLGLLNVPCPAGRPSAATPCRLSLSTTPNNAVNTFIRSFIDKYGYTVGGEATGGGVAGFGTTFDADDFFRTTAQVAYNLTLGSKVTHDLHVGFQQNDEAEDLARGTNGWGSITIPGGATTCPTTAACSGQPVFFQASFQQQSTGIPPIHSEMKSQNFEINDTIRIANWSFNVGVLASHDTLYGQGLAEADNVAGWVSSPGTKYEMYDIPFQKMIQPRLGATWAYNGVDTLYSSFAIYNSAVSSLPRAASWDRNLRATINGFFDASGVLIGVSPVAGSSGKLFLDDMKPRTSREYVIGTAQQITNGWSGRLYGRYRKTDHFWEDTNNTARVCFLNLVAGVCGPNSIPSNAPAGIRRELYMPDLQARRIAIGRGTPSGDTYVIANLDGAFTKYYEATLESDYRRGNAFMKGTYTWSHYYGNFDQDGSTGCPPCDDQNTFYGSSNIADSAGRQIWDNKYGDLHGDRRHILKVYGSYSLPWHASVGAWALYQSGMPWEMWNYEVYRPAVGGSTSDTIRYAEPAGSRREPAHQQVDLNYTQNFPLRGYNLQLAADMFNVFDKQTGRHFQPASHSGLFGQPTVSYNPRQYQLALRVQF